MAVPVGVTDGEGVMERLIVTEIEGERLKLGVTLGERLTLGVTLGVGVGDGGTITRFSMAVRPTGMLEGVYP